MSFKKIAYHVGDLFEMLTFDGNKKLDCENTGKQCIESFEIANTRKNRKKKFEISNAGRASRSNFMFCKLKKSSKR